MDYNDFERDLQACFVSQFDASHFTFSVNRVDPLLAEVNIIRLGSRKDTPTMRFDLRDCYVLERAKAAIRKRYLTKQG